MTGNGKILNPKQKTAVEFGNGPLLIIAGAGTGKTTVITERIKYLIVNKNIPASNILALTFTDKASFEMQERVDILLPYGYTNLWIHTFHSFCDKILRDEAFIIGLDPNYKLISEAESVFLMKKSIFDLGLKNYRPLGNPTKFLDSLLKHFSRLKDEDISPIQYLEWAEKLYTKVKNKEKQEQIEQYLELAHAYKTYEEIKQKQNLMDFSDLISNTLELFRKRTHILRKYQKQFQFILVDEFQDTNYAQNELAILLAGLGNKNITIVADDDQSIYRFRGAAVSNILQFKKKFPDAEIITLTDNYRSTQIILDAAYNLIQGNNPNRLEVVENIDKKLKSYTTAKQNNIEFIHTLRPEDEADEIAKKIGELSKKFDYKEIGILVRANNHAQPITAALQRYKIPFQLLGPGYLFQQEEIKDLIAYLIFLTNLMDSVALFRVLSMDIFKIPVIELNFLLNFAREKNLTLFESLSGLNLTFLTSDTQEKLINFKKMIEKHLILSKKEPAGQILFYFLVDSKLFETLQSTDSQTDERRVQNIAKFFERIKSFEIDREDSNIYVLVEWLTLMLQMGDSPTAAEIDLRDRNAVNILTIHSSKGLEFRVVFLINLVTDRFPTRERSERIPLPEALVKEKLTDNIDFHLQEERRLFYVGMTRAKEYLYFTASNYYGTGKRPKKISPFVYEALPHLKIENPFYQKVEQLSIADVLSTYNDKAKEPEEKKTLKLTYITYSNLQMFDICPLHYKAKIIFNIPTPISSAQSFGISIHNSLYKFYRQIQEGSKPSLNSLLDILNNEWISEGYNGKKHEQERFSQATDILRKFYKAECNPLVKPLELELPFSFILRNGVKVFGKIDRVDQKGKGIEIIDYKTGEDNPKAQKAHELQLAMYALAATKVKDAILNHDPKDVTLTLHFLEGNTKKSMNFSKNNLSKLEEELIKKIDNIQKSDFKCSGNVLCLNCEYKILCNLHARRY